MAPYRNYIDIDIYGYLTRIRRSHICSGPSVLCCFRLIINDDLDKGTQIPYIERALQEGYQVMVLNTNLNYWPDCGMNAKPIPVRNRY